MYNYKEQFIKRVENLKLNLNYGIYANMDYIFETSMIEKVQNEIFELQLQNISFTVFRLIDSVGNIFSKELVMGNYDIIYIDFIFNSKYQLIGILPIVNLNDDCKLKDIFYYDTSEFWIDLNRLQPKSPDIKYIHRISQKIIYMKNIISIYIKYVYGDIAKYICKYDKTTYVYEHYRNDGGLSFKHFSFDSLKSFILNGGYKKFGRINSNLFISLSGAYVPGKYIDIGYYDAIGGKEFGITENDIVFVIGFGAGLDLIYSLKIANAAYGIEINPFGVMSTDMNLKVAKLRHKAHIDLNDMRDIVSGKSIPNEYRGKITKLLWNIPYESSKRIDTPKHLKDFFDNYTVLEWFVPYLSQTDIFADNWKILLWKIVDDNQRIEDYFQKYDFRTITHNDENICIVLPPLKSVILEKYKI